MLGNKLALGNGEDTERKGKERKGKENEKARRNWTKERTGKIKKTEEEERKRNRQGGTGKKKERK